MSNITRRDHDNLANIILAAKRAYYVDGKPILTDGQYDTVERVLAHFAPDHPVLKIVGPG